jgi:glycosyltransferase involved in cell wall biosynthesis
VGVYIGEVPSTFGGAFTFQQDVLLALVKCAPRSAHEFIILGNLSPRDKAAAQQAGIALCELRGAARWRSVLRHFKEIVFGNLLLVLRAMGRKARLDKLAERLDLHMVWFVTPFYEPTDTPFVYTIWDLQHRVQPWFPEVSSGGRWEFREQNYLRVIPRATRVIVSNQAARRELQYLYGVSDERITLLPHPTPSFVLEDSAASTITEGARGEQRPYVLYPAQFWPHKNHVGLLRAVAWLRDYCGIELDVAMVGADRGNLEYVRLEAERLRMSAQTRFLGFVARSELLALYRGATALVYLSFFGPENLPPLEAFALSCPVIASRYAGADEQLGNAALLVDPTQPSEVGEAIRRVISDDQLRSSLVARGLLRAHAWTAVDYVQGVVSEFDRLAPVRACWGRQSTPVA